MSLGRWLTALAMLAIAAAFVGIHLWATAGQPPEPAYLPEPADEPIPAPEMTEEQPDQLVADAEAARESHVPVVAGLPLELPEDAIVAALVAKAHQNVKPPAGSNLRPLPLPFYLIVRDGEVASVSKATGDFQIGEGHQGTFQFLIAQMGRDRMQLVPTDFCQQRWGPWRDDYR